MLCYRWLPLSVLSRYPVVGGLGVVSSPFLENHWSTNLKVLARELWILVKKTLGWRGVVKRKGGTYSDFLFYTTVPRF